MDQTNRLQQDQINEYKQMIATLEIKLSNAISQSQYERDQMGRDRTDMTTQF